MSFNVFFVIILGVFVVYNFLVNLFMILFQITGLTKEKARFQVISLLTNSGFTTKESEAVTGHKMRRRLAVVVMITGNIFSILIVTLFINLVLSFDKTQIKDSIWIVLIAFASFLVLVIIIRLPFINKAIQNSIVKISNRIIKGKHKNAVTILDEFGDEAICKILVYSLPEILKDTCLADAMISKKYGINIMSLERNNRVVKVKADTIIQPGDVILVYGKYINIRDLFLNEGLVKVEEIESTDNVIEIIDNFHGEAMAKVFINKVPKNLENKTLLDSPLREKYNIVVLSINRNSNIFMATKDTIIEKDDELTVFGSYKDIKDVFLIKEEDN